METKHIDFKRHWPTESISTVCAKLNLRLKVMLWEWKIPPEIKCIKQLDVGAQREIDFLGYGINDLFPVTVAALTTVPIAGGMRRGVRVPVFAAAVNKLVAPRWASWWLAVCSQWAGLWDPSRAEPNTTKWNINTVQYGIFFFPNLKETVSRFDKVKQMEKFRREHLMISITWYKETYLFCICKWIVLLQAWWRIPRYLCHRGILKKYRKHTSSTLNKDNTDPG